MAAPDHPNAKLCTNLRRLPALARAAMLGDLLGASDAESVQRAEWRNDLIGVARTGGLEGVRGIIDRAARSGGWWWMYDRAHRAVCGLGPLELRGATRARALTELIAACGDDQDLADQLADEFAWEELGGAIEGAGRRGATQREAAAKFAAGQPALYGYLGTFLEDADDAVRAAACGGLKSGVLGKGQSGSGGSDDAGHLAVDLGSGHAVRGGADLEHYITLCLSTLARPVEASVRRAAAVGYIRALRRAVPRELPGIRELDDGAIEALRSAIRFSPVTEAAACAVRYLNDERLQRASRDRLLKLSTSAQRSAALELWHLCLHPARRAAMRAAMRIGDALNVVMQHGAETGTSRCIVGQRGLVPQPVELGVTLRSMRAGMGYVRVVSTLGAPAREKLLAPLLCAQSPVHRLVAVDSAPSALLADFAFDVNANVACAAASRWLCALSHRKTVAEQNANEILHLSRHAGVRALAASHESARAVGGIRLAAMRPSERLKGRSVGTVVSVEEACAQLLDRYTPARERADLAAQLRWNPDALKVAAQTLPTLMEECAGGEVEVHGNAGRVGYVESSGRADARVVANVIDSVARSVQRDDAGEFAPCVQSLIELKESGRHQRVRASALLALFVGGSFSAHDLCSHLVEILKDPRPAHRLSGAWLAGRVLAHHPGKIKLLGVREARNITDELAHAAVLGGGHSRAGHALLAWRHTFPNLKFEASTTTSERVDGYVDERQPSAGSEVEIPSEEGSPPLSLTFTAAPRAA
jgi:hypothetical protein